jgi:type IV pilus assembly protein PilE
LIELMIVVVVVAILALVAFPSYRGSVIKSRRSDGRGALLDLSARLEKYYYNNGTYAGATVNGLLGGTLSPEKLYNLSLSAPTAGCPSASCYEVQAAPVAGSSQADDAVCATLVFRSSGVKTASGSCGSDAACEKQCW